MIRVVKVTGVLVALVGGGAVLSACPAVLDDRCSENACVPFDAGGDANAAPDVVIPPGCNLTKSPKESPECVSDGVGVFVSPTGKDGAAGTKAEPLKSIAEAVTRGLPRVYVCEGTYEVPVAITAPIAIFGGLSCEWASSDARPKLAPPKGVALKVANVPGPVLVEDVDITASADALAAGDSAIGVFVSESVNVALRRVSITAGPGIEGARGAGPKSNYNGDKATVGNKAQAGLGGDEVACACLDGKTSSTGGRGGKVSGGESSPTSGSATPAVGGVNAGNNGNGNCVAGTNGAQGLATSAGAGSPNSGTLTVSGWDSSKIGAPGAAGNPGQGGGGGGGRVDAIVGGGGGGCGGCGGAGAQPGTNGGSSFALLVFESTVSVEGGALIAGSGGRGGEGGAGQDGQGGGDPGTSLSCNGGSGGAGAGGSGGGGGAGGHSVPIGYVGNEPTVNGATLKPDAKGSGGSGGEGGKGPGIAGTKGSAGPEGKSQNTLSL